MLLLASVKSVTNTENFPVTLIRKLFFGFLISKNCLEYVHIMKATNQRRKARTENYDAAFGSIFRISKFKDQAETLFYFYPTNKAA